MGKRHKKGHNWTCDLKNVSTANINQSSFAECLHDGTPLTQISITGYHATQPQRAHVTASLFSARTPFTRTFRHNFFWTKMSLTLTLTPATTPAKRKLHATLTSSTRASRHKDGIKEYSTHYRVHLSKRRLGGPKCGRCNTVRGVRFDQKCRYAVYDVGTGLIVEEGIGDVDFVGGKEIGFLWEDDDTVWEIEGDHSDLDGERGELDDLIREIEEVTEGEDENEEKEAKEAKE